jgi:hypothetical protein
MFRAVCTAQNYVGPGLIQNDRAKISLPEHALRIGQFGQQLV